MITMYMHAWCLRLPRFESCSQQRKANGRPLSIRKFLACARPSKLTTTIYTHGVLLYCVSCPRNTDYWCCAINSSSTVFFWVCFYTRLFYIAICISDLRVMHPWKVGRFCMLVYKCCTSHVFTTKYWYNKTHWWIHTCILLAFSQM